jgi:hypothetical protein
MFILDNFVRWIAEKVRDAAETELYDPVKIREALRGLGEAFDRGEIQKEEYRRRETALLDRLEEIDRQRKESSE